jgi:hypothetical protein
MMGSMTPPTPAASTQVLLLFAINELIGLLREPSRAEVSSATEQLLRDLWAVLCDPPVHQRLVEIRAAVEELGSRQADLERREARVSKVEAAMADLAAVTTH